jgi:hypothetical protein
MGNKCKKFLSDKQEGDIPFGRPKCIRMNVFKFNLQKWIARV